MVFQPLIWVLADDRAGNVAQALGVAEALNRPFMTKEIRYTPLARLPNVVQGARLVGLTADSRAALAPPWPDVVIAAGRRTAPVARWIKRQSTAPAILAHIMNPGRSGAAAFDLIAVPRHDRQVPGGDAVNVVRIIGAPHRVNAARLSAAAELWAAKVSGLPRPFIALIVGGTTHRKSFPAALASELARDVHRMAAEAGGSVLLATSRRTGREAEQALLSAIPEPRSAFLWSAGGENPYVGFLALADAIVVTGDSVSMCSEACAAPGSVYIFAPAGVVAPKHARLHRQLYDLGAARPFDGRFDDWRHSPLNAAGDVAGAIDELIHRRVSERQERTGT